LEAIDEDGLFGVHTIEIDGRLVSRDLLDSVREVDFIRRHVNLDDPDTTILDIGAGYGRLAYRLKQAAADKARVFVTDAFAPSTFISEYYLRFRKVDVPVIPLTEIDLFLDRQPISLAVNIHSFSECRLEAIVWWLSRLAKTRVKYLLVIPNARDERTGACLTNAGENMEIIFERHGYVPHLREPRFSDPAVQRHGIDPAYLCLFRLADET
jgi:SAM-dependent methyltransferase